MKPTARVRNRSNVNLMTDDEIIIKALQVMESRGTYNTEYFTNSKHTEEYLRLRLGSEEREIVSVMFLTSQNQLIACEDMFKGTIGASPVFPREVAKRALELNAAAIVVAHNHPSGEARPSRSDLDITKVLVNAMDLVGVRVLDHVIVTTKSSYSFANNGNM